MRNLKDSIGVGSPNSNFPYGQILNDSPGVNGTNVYSRIFGDILNAIHFFPLTEFGEIPNQSPDSSASIDNGIHRYQMSDNICYFVRQNMINGWDQRSGEPFQTGYVYDSYIAGGVRLNINSVIFSLLANVPDSLSCCFDSVNSIVNDEYNQLFIFGESNEPVPVIDESAYLFSRDNQNIFRIKVVSNVIEVTLNNQTFFSDSGTSFSFYPGDQYSYLIIKNLSSDLVFYKINSIGNPVLISNIETSVDDPIVSADLDQNFYCLIDSSPSKMIVIDLDGNKVTDFSFSDQYHTFRIINQSIYLFKKGINEVDVFDISFNWLKTFRTYSEIKFISHSQQFNRFICLDVVDNVGYLSKAL